MRYVTIENTYLSVSRIGFGTASLHHKLSSRQRQRLLEGAASAGVSHFDTSPYYGDGLAEEDLGRFLTGRRSAFTITTKVGLYPRRAPAGSAVQVWARKALGRLIPTFSLPLVNWHVDRARVSLEQSLKRLRTDYVDFLMLHEPAGHLIQADEFLNWLMAARKGGLIRAWGLAGITEHVAPWVESAHPLAAVVQTRDSLAQREADVLLRHGRRLQFTYGYLSAAAVTNGSVVSSTVLREALRRNATGSIIVSTRRLDRLAGITSAAE